MQAVITSTSFLAFLTYFGVGLAVLIVAAAIVALITPHRDIALIREGNAAAAAAFAGPLIGIALPLHRFNSGVATEVNAVSTSVFKVALDGTSITLLFAFNPHSPIGRNRAASDTEAAQA